MSGQPVVLPRRAGRISWPPGASVGALAWALGVLTLHPGWPEAMLLLAGLVYLAVGGVWTVIARAGLRPLGFPDLIVLLTAVHFHYAGFALPVLAGLVARASGGS